MTRDRKTPEWRSIGGVLLIHLLFAWALLTGLRVDVVRELTGGLDVFDVRAVPPPPETESPQSPDPEREGGAAPENRRSSASPVVAPEPAIVVPRPSPVVAAPEPFDGAATTQGAADPGPGTGAGGEGTGTGSGAGGGGTGGGAVVGARKIAGEIRPRDYPDTAARARIEGTVGANVYIGADGRVTRCVVARSSGNAALDETTCRLIRARFRYEPARNAAGEAMADVRGWEQRWWLGRD